MNILFVLYNGMACNSAIHVASLARGLTAMGEGCAVAVPDRDFEPAAHPAADALQVLPFRDLRRTATLFDGHRPPDVVVAWTPRENVRRAIDRIRRCIRVPLVVHLEDNEDAVTARHFGVEIAALRRLSLRQRRELFDRPLSHPRRMRALLARADGISMLMDRLEAFCPPGIPSRLFWPGYDEALFGDIAQIKTMDFSRAETQRRSVGLLQPERAAHRARLGVPPEAGIIVYTGNIHRGNAADMALLYEAVGELNRRGTAMRLVRTGEHHAEGFTRQMAHLAPWVIDLGFRPREELPGLLSLADVLVQPGPPGAFNDYRFPSKLPEFMVSGRPVVMSKTNLGNFLKPGEEAWIVPNGTVGELVDAITRLRTEPALADAIGAGGWEFARRFLRWDLAAASLRTLLEEVIGSRKSIVNRNRRP